MAVLRHVLRTKGGVDGAVTASVDEQNGDE